MAKLNTNTHPLITEYVIASLEEKNIYTTFNFIECDLNRLVYITNLSRKDILSIKKHIINKNSAVVRNGYEHYLEVLSKFAIIPTGIKGIDDLLDGGLITGNIYEICGRPASGKTQFCFTLIKQLVKNLQLHACYIDTKRDFNVKRIINIVNLNNETELAKILESIMVIKINTKHEILNALYEIKQRLENDLLKLRVIIIDSLPPILFTSTNYMENNYILNHIVNVMHFLANEYGLMFIVTNVITTWHDGDFNDYNITSLKETVSCGKYWLNIPNVRLKFIKLDDTSKINVTIEKCNKIITNKECCININNLGII